MFLADPKTNGGQLIQGADGELVPLWQPGFTQVQNWLSVQGAEIFLRTTSFYVNDRWTVNNKLSFNLGARYERHTADTTQAGIATPNSSAFVPRLGVTFDPQGDGQYVLQATYAHYAGKQSETQFAGNTNVGNPDAIYYIYTGPAGQGRAFAPGITPANYSEIQTGVFPTANVLYASDVKSPVTREWTGAAGMQVGHNGYLKAIYTHRSVDDFVQQFVTRDTGITHVVKNGIDFGNFANRLWANTDDGERVYDALQFQAGIRPTSRWNLQGHYTLQLKNDGNQEGEAPNQPGAPSFFSGYYPEIFSCLLYTSDAADE